MRSMLRGLGITLLALAVVPFLADLRLPLGLAGPGVAWARGGGGHGGGGGGDHGDGEGGGSGADHGGGQGETGGSTGEQEGAPGGMQGSETGNEVSGAATSTAHAGRAEATEDGFPNLGQAVSTAVHGAIRDRARDRGRQHEVEGVEMPSLSLGAGQAAPSDR